MKCLWLVFNIVLWTQIAGAGESPCESLYTGLWADKELEVLIVYGYKDSRPHRFVGDRHERLTLVQKLLSPCEVGEKFLCGFIREKDDGERFFRKMKNSREQNVTIRLNVLAASRGPDDAVNRKSEFQNHSSQYVRRTFLQGFDNYEIVLYNGHSRAGGGPDFFPPRIRKDNSVDYGYYQSQQPGFTKILENLKENAKAKVFGLFSCASSKYFRKKIIKQKKDLALISSPNLLYYTDANQNMFEAIKGLIAGRCEDEINRSMKAGVPRVGSRLELPSNTNSIK